MKRKKYMTQKRKLKRKRLALLSILSVSMIGLGAGILFLDNNTNLISKLGASVVTISNYNKSYSYYVDDALVLNAHCEGVWSPNSSSYFTWRSKGAQVATVTLKKAGEVTITNDCSNWNNVDSRYFKIYIYNKLKSVSINGSTTVKVGNSITLTAAVNSGAKGTIRWSSSDASIATVNATTGKVTGKKEGKVTITAKATDNGTTVKATKAIVVRYSSSTTSSSSLSLNPSSKTIEVGKTTTIESDTSALWSSSDTSIATVSTSKATTSITITGKRAGTATITATSTSNSSIKKTVKITVTSSASKEDNKTTNNSSTSTSSSSSSTVTSLKLNASTKVLITGSKYTLKATVKPSSSKVTWSSSNTNVATVSSSGVVTAKKAGTATITAKSGSKSVKATITVKDATNSISTNQGATTTVSSSSDKKSVTLTSSDGDGLKSVVVRDTSSTGNVLLTKTYQNSKKETLNLSSNLPSTEKTNKYHIKMVDTVGNSSWNTLVIRKNSDNTYSTNNSPTLKKIEAKIEDNETVVYFTFTDANKINKLGYKNLSSGAKYSYTNIDSKDVQTTATLKVKLSEMSYKSSTGYYYIYVYAKENSSYNCYTIKRVMLKIK